MKGLIDERINRWKDERLKGWKDERRNEWKDERIRRDKINNKLEGWINIILSLGVGFN